MILISDAKSSKGFCQLSMNLFKFIPLCTYSRRIPSMLQTSWFIKLHQLLFQTDTHFPQSYARRSIGFYCLSKNPFISIPSCTYSRRISLILEHNGEEKVLFQDQTVLSRAHTICEILWELNAFWGSILMTEWYETYGIIAVSVINLS